MNKYVTKNLMLTKKLNTKPKAQIIPNWNDNSSDAIYRNNVLIELLYLQCINRPVAQI